MFNYFIEKTTLWLTQWLSINNWLDYVLAKSHKKAFNTRYLKMLYFQIFFLPIYIVKKKLVLIFIKNLYLQQWFLPQISRKQISSTLMPSDYLGGQLYSSRPQSPCLHTLVLTEPSRLQQSLVPLNRHVSRQLAVHDVETLSIGGNILLRDRSRYMNGLRKSKLLLWL